MTTTKQWQALIDQQRSSNISIKKFCKQHNIGYATFYKWRKCLNIAPDNTALDSNKANFVDLSSVRRQLS